MDSLSLAVERLEERMDAVDRFLGGEDDEEVGGVDGLSLGDGGGGGKGKGKGKRREMSDSERISHKLSKLLRFDIDARYVNSSGRVEMDVVSRITGESADAIRACIGAQTDLRIGTETNGGVEYVYCYQGHDSKYFDTSGGPISRSLIYKALPASFGYAVFHSTTEPNAEIILREGLKPKARDVHMFSSDSDKKGRLGPKFNALFKVDVKRAIEDGFEFWVAGNGVILCERPIPPKYLELRILEVRDKAVVEPDWKTDPYYSKPF